MVDQTEVLAFLVGAIMPPVVDKVIGNRALPSWAKLTIALVTSAVVGTLIAWATGDLTGAWASGWLNAVGVAFMASQVFYRTWWNREKKTPNQQPPASGVGVTR